MSGTEAQEIAGGTDLVLDGVWRATPADGDLARDFAASDFPDDAWPEVQVPGHWREIGRAHV